MSRKKCVLYVLFLIVIISIFKSNKVYAGVKFSDEPPHDERNVISYDGYNAYGSLDGVITDYKFYLIGADGTKKETFCCARGLRYSENGYSLGDGHGGFDVVIYNKLAAFFSDSTLMSFFPSRYQRQMITWYISSGGEFKYNVVTSIGDFMTRSLRDDR